jgi:hypothetical protein
MKNHNPDNERIKRLYFAFLKEAKGLSESSVDAAAKVSRPFTLNRRPLSRGNSPRKSDIDLASLSVRQPSATRLPR